MIATATITKTIAAFYESKTWYQDRYQLHRIDVVPQSFMPAGRDHQFVNGVLYVAPGVDWTRLVSVSA